MINTAGARFLGRSVEEVVGKDDTAVFAPETARQIMERDREILAAGQTKTFEQVATAAGVTRTFYNARASIATAPARWRACSASPATLPTANGRKTHCGLRKSATRRVERNLAGVLRSTVDGAFSIATRPAPGSWAVLRLPKSSGSPCPPYVDRADREMLLTRLYREKSLPDMEFRLPPRMVPTAGCWPTSA